MPASQDSVRTTTQEFFQVCLGLRALPVVLPLPLIVCCDVFEDLCTDLRQGLASFNHAHACSQDYQICDSPGIDIQGTMRLRHMSTAIWSLQSQVALLSGAQYSVKMLARILQAIQDPQRIKFWVMSKLCE